MEDLKGYAGSILNVDLSSGSIKPGSTGAYCDRFLGGRGIAAKIYWDEVHPQVGAFDPENRLIFITGPATATTGFAGSRWQVCGKSPQQDRFCYSNLGGAWGAKLKESGYDGLVVSGKAESPVFFIPHYNNVPYAATQALLGHRLMNLLETTRPYFGKEVKR